MNVTKRNAIIKKRYLELKDKFQFKYQVAEVIAKELNIKPHIAMGVIKTTTRKPDYVIYKDNKEVFRVNRKSLIIKYFEIKGYEYKIIESRIKVGTEFDGYSILRDK